MASPRLSTIIVVSSWIMACTEAGSPAISEVAQREVVLTDESKARLDKDIAAGRFGNCLRVGDMEPNGPAAAAGLRRGDRLERINGEIVRRQSFAGLLGQWRAEDGPLLVTVARSGESIELSVMPNVSDGKAHLGVVLDFEHCPK